VCHIWLTLSSPGGCLGRMQEGFEVPTEEGEGALLNEEEDETY
jgi:hypothetical protein